jgi:2-iminobutanoate/2-iminopropanoate deaminase
MEAKMSKKAIFGESGPVGNSPYSPAVRVGDIVYVSGQIPLDPATSRVVEGDFDQQVRQCIRNLSSLLKQEGLTLEHVVKTTVFLQDLNDFQAMNKIYGTYFSGVKPARSTVQVARLPMDVAVEIEAIAYAGSE